jgi:cold shock CspA family protein/ribosome-associated translation inhibitor RaiA
MQLPLQVSFRHMERSPALEAMIVDRATKLDKFAGHITSCRVVIDPAGRHRLHGQQYEVRIDITLPEGEVVSTREPSEHKEYKEIAIAIRDAFDSARRALEDYVRLERGAVKAHVRPPHARVSKLMPDQNCGFLITPDGGEIYFHRNSVLNDAFDRLEVGTEVAYAEEEGDRGSQASTVKVVGRHGGI